MHLEIQNVPCRRLAATLLVGLSGLLLTPTAGHAQLKRTVHPVQAATGGNINNGIPFAWVPVRYQQILDWRAFSAAGSFQFEKIRFRMATDFGGRFGGQTVTLSMSMALTPRGVDAANAATTFASNVDASTRKSVVARRTITLPKLSGRAFDFVIPFDAGRKFIYRTADQRNVVLDFEVFGNSAGNKRFTYPMDAFRGTPLGRVRTNGSFNGCQNALRSSVPGTRALSQTLHVGNAEHAVTGYCGLAGVPSILLLGSRSFSGVRIGSCELKNDAALVLTTLSRGKSGDVRFPIPIPNESRFKGMSFLTQIWWYEVGATPTGFYAAKGLQQTVSTQDKAIVTTRVYGGLTDPKGSAHRGTGLVVALEG